MFLKNTPLQTSDVMIIQLIPIPIIEEVVFMWYGYQFSITLIEAASGRLHYSRRGPSSGLRCPPPPAVESIVMDGKRIPPKELRFVLGAFFENVGSPKGAPKNAPKWCVWEVCWV